MEEKVTTNIRLMSLSITDLKSIMDYSSMQIQECDKVINKWFQSQSFKEEFGKLKKRYSQLYFSVFNELNARCWLLSKEMKEDNILLSNIKMEK